MDKKTTVLLMMRDGSINAVVSDDRDAVEVLMVNVCSEGSPQTDVQPLKITFSDGDTQDLLVSITRIGVKSPPPGGKDTVIDQFVAACPEGEYDIDHIEHIQVEQEAPGKVRVVKDMNDVGTESVIDAFAEVYRVAFGETLSPDELRKYKPE